MKKANIYLGVIATATTLLVSACGGGGGDSGNNTSTDANPFAALVGTWSSGCLSRTSSVPGPNGSTIQILESGLVTAVVSNPNGVDKASVSIDTKSYRGSTTCTAANLDQQGAIKGQVTALAGTKAIAGDADHPKTGIAKTATFRFDELTTLFNISTTIPNLGNTSTVGYMLEGGKLYGVSGSKQPDGLGQRFANVTLTKQ